MEQESKTAFNKAEFKEIGRVVVSSSVDLVVSEITKKGSLQGYNVNRYIQTEGYTGFVKGQEIPVSCLTEFLRVFPKKNLEDALKGKIL